MAGSKPPTCADTPIVDVAEVDAADALPLLLPRCAPTEFDRWFVTSQSSRQIQVVLTDRPVAGEKYVPGMWLSVWRGEASGGEPTWSDRIPMTIRGHNAYGHADTASQPGTSLTWEEEPGVWVLVAASERYDLAFLTQLAESLIRVDPTVFAAHVSS